LQRNRSGKGWALKNCQIRPVCFVSPPSSQDKLLRHAAHAYIVYWIVKGTSFFSVFLGFLFGVWVVTLWMLSSLPGQDIHLPPFPEADKVAHFGYFFIGGISSRVSVEEDTGLARTETVMWRAVCDRLDWSPG
jgi:hypothetical protein